MEQNYLRQTIDYARFHNYNVGDAIKKYSAYQTKYMKKGEFLPSEIENKKAHYKVREDIIKQYLK